MGSILSNLKSTVIAGLILTLIFFVGVRLVTGVGFSLDARSEERRVGKEC